MIPPSGWAGIATSGKFFLGKCVLVKYLRLCLVKSRQISTLSVIHDHDHVIMIKYCICKKKHQSVAFDLVFSRDFEGLQMI